MQVEKISVNQSLEASPPSERIFALSAPDPALLTSYALRSLLTGPGVLVLLPYYYFRFRTLRYTFDDEGIHMRVGVLFRREVNLTYARIQDIHLNASFIQRWLGLADIQVQTASGSSGAELVIEGFKEFEAIRDFLYARMRGTRGLPAAAPSTDSTVPAPNDETIALLCEIRDEMRRTRESLEARTPAPPPPQPPA